MTSKSIWLAAIAVIAISGAAAAGPGEKGHGHGGPAFGEPGDPAKPARMVEISMRETGDGKMIFNHNYVEVKKGEQIRFALHNFGGTDHEFVLSTLQNNLAHAKEMEKNPEMEHDDPNAKRLAPSAKGEVVWKFTKAGTFDFSCLIPGHREAGMFGTVVVK